jgi:hypothetical protein
MVLPLDKSTNDEDDDAGETGIADDAGREYERCGMGTCDPTESIGNTGLGAQVDGLLCFAERLSDLDDDNVDATVDDSAMVFRH